MAISTGVCMLCCSDKKGKMIIILKESMAKSFLCLTTETLYTLFFLGGCTPR